MSIRRLGYSPEPRSASRYALARDEGRWLPVCVWATLGAHALSPWPDVGKWSIAKHHAGTWDRLVWRHGFVLSASHCLGIR